MNSPQLEEKPRRSADELSTRNLLKVFVPLSLSDIIMVFSGPIIGLVLARLPDVNVHLAAHGASLSLAILLESPIIMMLQASTAASANASAFAALWRLLWVYNGAITLLHAAVVFTPVYGWVAEVLLGLPAPVAAAARPALAVMLLWPATIGYRRYLQGLLIRHRRSRDVMYAGFARIGTLVVTLALGAAAGVPGATLAGLGLTLSVVGEAAAVAFFAHRLRRTQATSAPVAEFAGETVTPNGVPLRFGGLFWWYLPLAGTQVLVWLTRPALTAGIARAPLAEVSLAAWPIAWITVMVLANGTRMIQQLTLSLVSDAESARRVRNFTVQVGLVFSAFMALLAFTPLADGYLKGVVGLPPELAAVSQPVLMIAVLYPLGVALQNWFQGLLVQAGQTGRVNAAAFIGGALSVVLVFVGAYRLQISGAATAALAAMAGILTEVGVLWWFSASARRRYRGASAPPQTEGS